MKTRKSLVVTVLAVILLLVAAIPAVANDI